MRAVISTYSFSGVAAYRLVSSNAVRSRASGSHIVSVCLGPERDIPDPHARQRWTSPFGEPGIRAGNPKKARSVVALSRVPR
jgi:hypothetical protein